jgi:uncharacterized membrane protein
MIAAYFVTLLVFAGIDFIWLGFVASGYYRSQIGHLLADPINLPAAAAFYLIYVVGIMLFAVQPAVAAGGVSGGVVRAFMQGALFGFFCYATYDLTNLATLKGWSLPLSLLDMAWGALLTGIASAAGTYVAAHL